MIKVRDLRAGDYVEFFYDKEVVRSVVISVKKLENLFDLYEVILGNQIELNVPWFFEFTKVDN